MKFIIFITLVAASAGLCWTQEPQESPAVLMAKADLVEAQEGNLSLALQLYQRATTAESLKKSERAMALYKQAILEKKLGRLDEARKSLEAAAQGEGEFAERAESLLKTGLANQEEGADWQDSGRVHRAISKLYKSDTASDGVGELALIGDIAVPALAEALKNEKTDIGFVGKGVEAMLRIGGARVAKWFAAMVTDPDVIYRRTVMLSLWRDLTNNGIGKIQSLGIVKELEQLLSDDDTSVAAGACKILGSLQVDYSPSAYLSVVERVDSNTKKELLGQINLRSMRAALLASDDLRERLLQDFVKSFKGDNTALRGQVRQLAERIGVDEFASSPDFWFELETRLDADSHLGTVAGLRLRPKEDFKLGRALFLLKKLPEAEFDAWHQSKRDDPTTRIGTLAQVMDFMAAKRPKDCEAALETIRLLGPSPLLFQMEQMVANNAGPELVAPVVAAIARFSQPDYTGVLLQRQGLKLNEAELAPIFAWFRERAEQEDEVGEFIQGTIGQMVQFVAYQRTAAAMDGLMDLIEFDARFFMPMAERMTKLDIPEALPYLVTLMGRDDKGDLQDAARNLVFQKLLVSGYKPAVPALVKAPALGLRHGHVSYTVNGKGRTYPAPQPETYGIRNLDKFIEKWSEEDLVAIVNGCLDADIATYSQDILGWYLNFKKYLRAEWGKGSFSPKLNALIERRVSDLDDQTRDRVLQEIQDNPSAITDYDAFLEKTVGHSDPKIASQTVRHLPVPLSSLAREYLHRILSEPEFSHLQSQALAKIRESGEAEYWPEVVGTLEGDDYRVRTEALRTLLELDEAQAFPLVLPLSRDPSNHVRANLCKCLSLRPDRQSVPVLIQLLRDEAPEVRKEANDALREIEFYFEQKDRWEKWLKGAGLESGDAASALLEQAAPGQPKEQRLVAIQSLATLAVPETLPILIGWMSDSDPEVAAAAKAAVAKINGN